MRIKIIFIIATLLMFGLLIAACQAAVGPAGPTG